MEDPSLDARSLHLFRNLDESLRAHRGRIVLIVLYVGVMALCVVAPIFYYCRLRSDDRAARRLRELEIASMRSILERSESQNSTAVRRKYIEERRARIVQLFAPVRTVLTNANFPHLPKSSDMIRGDKATKTLQSEPPPEAPAADENSTFHDSGNDGDDDDESFSIEIPEPGLFFNDDIEDRPALRIAPGTCTICLSTYQVGSDVVWSSNADCEHVFHVSCAEQWLLRQREGPLCPCCRRDFIIDPVDVNVVESGEEGSDDPVIVWEGDREALFYRP